MAVGICGVNQIAQLHQTLGVGLGFGRERFVPGHGRHPHFSAGAVVNFQCAFDVGRKASPLPLAQGQRIHQP